MKKILLLTMLLALPLSPALAAEAGDAGARMRASGIDPNSAHACQQFLDYFQNKSRKAAEEVGAPFDPVENRAILIKFLTTPRNGQPAPCVVTK